MSAALLLSKVSTVQRAAEVLRAGLREGRWAQGLPGERPLSVQLGISRPTLRQALAVLRQSGLVRVAQGKRSQPTRKAAGAKRPAAARAVLALVPEPLHRLPSAAIFTFDELRAHMAEAGLRLEIRAFRPPRRQHAAALQALHAAEPTAVWLLYQQERAVHRWVRERGLPSVVFGTQDASFPLPAVDLDQRATCRHAALTFRRLGFAGSQIALVVPDLSLPGHLLMRDGLREALGEEARLAALPLVSRGLVKALDRLIEEMGRPAALIFARARHAVGALGHYAITRGWRVPEEIALLCLNDDPFLQFLQPSVAHYRRDHGALARRLCRFVVRAASGQRLAARMTLLMPEFIPGKTIPSRPLVNRSDQ